LTFNCKQVVRSKCYGPLPNHTCGMIICINVVCQLQNSCSFSAKVTPVATQLKLTTSLHCDHGQTMIDYHHIYFVYIHPYKVQVATNVKLNYNYEIFWHEILIINSSYFHTIVVPYLHNSFHDDLVAC